MSGAISESFEVEGARDQVEEIRTQEVQRRKRKAEGRPKPAGAWADNTGASAWYLQLDSS